MTRRKPPAEPVVRTCADPKCGKQFRVHRDWQRFCSKKCRELWSRLGAQGQPFSEPANTETLAPPVERSAACLHWERDIENEIAV